MRTGRSETVDVLRSWMADRLIVRVEAGISCFTVGLEARVLFVSDREVRLLSDNNSSEFNLRLSDDLIFEYNDNRVVQNEAKEFREAIIVLFHELTGDEGTDFERITFGAIENRRE